MVEQSEQNQVVILPKGCIPLVGDLVTIVGPVAASVSFEESSTFEAVRQDWDIAKRAWDSLMRKVAAMGGDIFFLGIQQQEFTGVRGEALIEGDVGKLKPNVDPKELTSRIPKKPGLAALKKSH